MTVPQALSVVVFDLGNVLIRWDPVRAFHGVLDPDDVPAFLAEIDFSGWNHHQDAGRPWQEAEEELSARFPHRGAAIRAYAPNFRATLEAMPESVALLEELSDRGVRLLALTNWSAELFGTARDTFPFLSAFEGIVVSGEERLAKPDRRLYEVLLRRYRVAPSSALFVDDSAANVGAAEEVGLKGHLFTSAAALRAELVEAGLLPAAT